MHHDGDGQRNLNNSPFPSGTYVEYTLCIHSHSTVNRQTYWNEKAAIFKITIHEYFK